MAQINLAPGSQYLVMARRRRRLLYSLTALLAIAAIGIGGALAWLSTQTQATKQSLTQELQSIEMQIATASEQVKKIQLFESRLASLDQLLKQHRVWSLHLQELERLLPADTVLSSLKGSHDTGTLELGGSAPNIDNVSVALANLQNQAPAHTTLFETGTITNVTQVDETGPAGEVVGQRYTFKMNLRF